MKKQSVLLAILSVFTVSVSTFAGEAHTSNVVSAQSVVGTIVTVLTQIVNLVP